VCCSVLQCGAVSCSVLQCVAASCRDTSRCDNVEVCSCMYEVIAVYHSVLQRVVAYCRVLQRVAACCGVLQRVAVIYTSSRRDCTEV